MSTVLLFIILLYVVVHAEVCIDKEFITECYIGNWTELANVISSSTTKDFIEITIQENIQTIHNQISIPNGKDITIFGSNYIVSGNENDRFFHVQAGAALNIFNWIVTGIGDVIDVYYGAAILNDGNLNIYNATFSNHIALNYGGAIANNNSCTITDSIFTANGVDKTYGHGAAIYNQGNLAINYTLFSRSKRCYYGRGGAIYSVHGLLNISYSTFEQTYRVGHGGAIFNKDTILLINHSFFTDNDAWWHGGAIHLYETDFILINNATFIDNFADKKVSLFSLLFLQGLLNNYCREEGYIAIMV